MDAKVEDFVRRQFARDVAAYLLDRADQYETASGCWICLSDAAHAVINGEVQAAKVNGDLDDDLYRRVDGFRGPAPKVAPKMGIAPEDEEEIA